MLKRSTVERYKKKQLGKEVKRIAKEQQTPNFFRQKLKLVLVELVLNSSEQRRNGPEGKRNRKEEVKKNPRDKERQRELAANKKSFVFQ